MLVKILSRLPFTFMALAAVLMYVAVFDPQSASKPGWQKGLMAAAAVACFVLAGYGLSHRHRPPLE